MDDSDTADSGHGHSHGRFDDGVHRRRYAGHCEVDDAAEFGAELDCVYGY